MPILYPAYVVSEKIIECQKENGIYRYYLSIPFCTVNNSKSLLVILKNPSTADAKMSDQTANQICKYAFKNGFGRAIIVNLFAYRSKDKNHLKSVYKSYNNNFQYIVGPENDNFIKKAISEASQIIVAWGGSPDNFEDIYDRRIKELHRLLDGQALNYIDSLTQSKYPKHAQIWPTETVVKDYRRDCGLFQ